MLVQVGGGACVSAEEGGRAREGLAEEAGRGTEVRHCFEFVCLAWLGLWGSGGDDEG